MFRATPVIREIARLVGGGGGGRPDFAEAGGREPEKLGEALDAGQMAVLKTGVSADLQSTGGAIAMLLGGAPLDGPRFIEWNFVSSSREKIEAAKLAWTEQRMGKVPGETEFIPLPPPRHQANTPDA